MPAPAINPFADYPDDLRSYLEAAPETRPDEEHIRFIQSLTEEQRDYIAWYRTDYVANPGLSYKWPSRTVESAVNHTLDLCDPEAPWARPGHEAVFAQAEALNADISGRQQKFEPEIAQAYRGESDKLKAAHARMMASPPEPLFDPWPDVVTGSDIKLLRYLTQPHRLEYLAEQEARDRATNSLYQWESEDAQMLLTAVRSAAEDTESPAAPLAAQWLKLFDLRVSAVPNALDRVPEAVRAQVLKEQEDESYVADMRARYPARGNAAALARGEAEQQQVLIDAIRRDHPEMHIWSDDDIKQHPETAMNALLELKSAKKATEPPPL